MRKSIFAHQAALGISYGCLVVLAPCVAVSFHQGWYGWAAFGLIGGGFHFVNIGMIKQNITALKAKEKYESLKKVG